MPTTPRRFRILHILEATVGGTREHVLQALRGVDRTRFELSLLCSCGRDPAFARDIAALRSEGIAVDVIPMRRAISPWRDAVAFLRIFRHLSRNRYDLVHTHSSKAGFLGRAAAWLAGVRRIVHTGHIFYFQWRLGTPAGKFYRLLEWLPARVSDRIVALSEEQRDVLIRCGVARPRQTVVLPNGVRLSRWRGLPPKGEACDRLGVPRDACVVGMAARLEKQKGCRHFLRAAKHVLTAFPSAHFVLVGDGSYAADLARLADELKLGERFHLVGHWEDMPAFFAALDLFALTSLWEGMPYVVLEAMACGLPVCATDIPGTREVVRDGATGVLVPAENDAALAGAIAHLLANPGRMAALGGAGRALVREHYTEAVFIRRLEAFYRDVLNDTP